MTLKNVIRSFKCNEESDSVSNINKITKPTSKSPRSKKKHPSNQQPSNQHPSNPTLQDLPPSIKPNILLVFVGFNPGVESSKQQHHYAHFTNLFWKLFNHLNLLRLVLHKQHMTMNGDKFLNELFNEDGTCNAAARHDNDLLDYGIGFTDLVLRCTKAAQELSMKEKIANVPRILSEFDTCQAPFIVIIGKGIWEIIVKYLLPAHKLKKESFKWGFQDPVSPVMKEFHRQCHYNPSVYVFPNTSGLVALMKWPQKLELWQDLVEDIKTR